ncbi:MAG: sugar phosphate isomerase/epimerase [Parasporobacterium sp.]|nr:sugar phosphate isomerase/epimerase [Parasporobacterium sp.]
MKFAVSNIAWSPDEDTSMYEYLCEQRLALEIAPTRIIPWDDSNTLGRMAGPYDRIRDAANWAKNLYAKYGLNVVSMQSILNGVKANMYGKQEERRFLTDYMKSAIDFAAAVKCRNLVFGCPLNRRIPDGFPLPEAGKVAIDFFSEVAMYAAQQGTCVSIEANPAIYNTNFINYTSQAFDLVRCIAREVGRNASKAFRVNFDVGTVITNGENIFELLTDDNIALINHVHFSEPNLRVIRQRKEHFDIIRLLEEAGYDRYISLEMRMPEQQSELIEAIEYIKKMQ